ncbi:Nuclear receptor-binding protein [Trichinella nelsoni]|uniref:Nuclear receptor-binding protein n=1 Tax=Trichinella nelsoni TaxID=6336 RepID=A0A0V0RSQ8_9BILA|nr:Nuclear receptor-binding protein [Trichinella nelsoni]
MHCNSVAVLLAFGLIVWTFFGVSSAMCCVGRMISSYAVVAGCSEVKRSVRVDKRRQDQGHIFANAYNFMDMRKQSTASLSDDDSDEESDAVLEESPCGRWQKRRERVSQRDVPGIDAAYLAMDTELGVEVVWNEVHFSERRKLRAELQEIRLVFDRLTRLEHPNLIKLHSYWLDTNSDKQRVIFITEYMSSGSVSQFMKRTARGGKALGLKAWKKWCMPVLLALDYLHSFEPPVVHCNLTSDTIFIQQNGLIKIGCVTPYLIHQHVKTYRENIRNLHYIAPEYRRIGDQLSPAVDIYAFGICALEMALQGVAGTSPDQIQRSLQLVEDDEQRRLISLCLEHDPCVRPSARQLILQPALFEVPSLRLLAAHMVILDYFDSSFADCDARLRKDKTRVLAEIVRPDGESSCRLTEYDMPATDLNKFLEDVRTGVYPLTALKRRATSAYCTDAGRRGRIDENGGPVDGRGRDRSRAHAFHTVPEHRLCNVRGQHAPGVELRNCRHRHRRGVVRRAGPLRLHSTQRPAQLCQVDHQRRRSVQAQSIVGRRQVAMTNLGHRFLANQWESSGLLNKTVEPFVKSRRTRRLYQIHTFLSMFPVFLKFGLFGSICGFETMKMNTTKVREKLLADEAWHPK